MSTLRDALPRRVYPTLVAGLLLWLPHGALAAAPGQGDWLVRVMAMGVIPIDASASISDIGGDVEIPAYVTPGVSLSYFLTDHWALEFQGGVSRADYRVTGSRIGDFDVGSIKTASVSLVAQYHFRPQGAWSPYLGLGVNHARALKVEPADNIPDFEIDPLTSLILNAGLDYRFSKRWFASASLHYLVMPTYTFEGSGFSADVSLNTVIPGIGVGYRF